MTRWIREWFTLSALVLLAGFSLVLLWATWPLLSARLVALPGAALDLEAIAALVLLLFVGIGYIKLVWGK